MKVRTHKRLKQELIVELALTILTVVDVGKNSAREYARQIVDAAEIIIYHMALDLGLPTDDDGGEEHADVLIEVRGGIAEVIHKPKDVEVVIQDWDNNDDGDRGYTDEIRENNDFAQDDDFSNMSAEDML